MAPGGEFTDCLEVLDRLTSEFAAYLETLED